MRDFGHVEGISGSVSAPTWEARIDEEHGSYATAGVVHPPLYDDAPPLRIGDTLHVVHFSPGGGRNAKKFKACGTNVSLGSISLGGFNNEALVVFASRSSQETFAPDQSLDIINKIGESGDFKTLSSDGVVQPELCIEPVQHIDPITENCDEHGVCRTMLTLSLTYRIRKTNNIVFRSGLGTTVTSGAYLRNISGADKDSLIRADLAKEAEKLLILIVDQPSFKAGIAGL
jgi:hypothetical protein